MVGTVVLVLLLAAALAAGGVWLVRVVRAELAGLRAESTDRLGERSTDIDRRLAGMTETMDRRFGELDTKVDRRLGELDVKVDRRLAGMSETSDKIHERLGKVDEATAQMNERAKEFQRFEQLLRPPKARGGVGELLLANLLADILPAARFDLQHGFRSGERVDAVIRLDDALIPVDAKFPLDNFQRFVEAEDDATRDLHAKALARDVKGHVDAIAQKYIRPDEGTYEFALMYLPAEAVYYELVCNRIGGDASPLAYAQERKVIPVSPSTFHAYLLVLVQGLKGLKIEEHAREVMTYVADLNRDFARFKADFDLVGKHLGNAHTKYAESERRLSRFETKLERAAESEPLEEPAAELAELPRAADAA
ncbi:MAG TPA: DNA recombination protein RmuC [Gaiellaceae bacterium]|nr:DNA recombination protein RmuC [Gaiellaceae bacterium]